MSAITPHLTLTATLLRNSSPTGTATGAWRDNYASVGTIKCRISQPARQRAVIGLQPVADLAPIIQFEPDEDVRDQDRVTIIDGTPSQLVGTTWDVYSPVVPSVPHYLSATARRIETTNG